MKEPNARVVKKLQQHGAFCAIAAPVWHELVFGSSRLPAGRRRAALEEYLHAVVRRSFAILPYDEAAAEWHGQESSPRRSRQDRPVRRRPDCGDSLYPTAHPGHREHQGLPSLRGPRDPRLDLTAEQSFQREPRRRGEASGPPNGGSRSVESRAPESERGPSGSSSSSSCGVVLGGGAAGGLFEAGAPGSGPVGGAADGPGPAGAMGTPGSETGGCRSSGAGAAAGAAR